MAHRPRRRRSSIRRAGRAHVGQFTATTTATTSSQLLADGAARGPRSTTTRSRSSRRSSTSRRRRLRQQPEHRPVLGGEIQGRLTMRDVILVNEDSKVKAKLKNPQTGHLLEPVHADHLRDRRPGHPRLDRGRRRPSRRARARSGEAEVPLRQHALRGVRRRDPAPEHPRPAGGASSSPGRPRTRSRSCSATSTRTTTPGQARRPAGVPDARRRRVHRAQHGEPAELLRERPVHLAADRSSTTRSTTCDQHGQEGEAGRTRR